MSDNNLISEDDIFLDKLSNFIFNSVRDKRWLYWPPGPMTSQVFDVKQCKEDLRRWISAEGK